ncbi:FtsK/SpoIIIE domain-containing protein [Aquipuribacter sp. MA13-6]|uniref:FtsK/SpoIIIE domain-containing protein n=1 Tax=unclassified Aquipuribacter TaxID=2635084 RepID=UPI003EEFE373
MTAAPTAMGATEVPRARRGLDLGRVRQGWWGLLTAVWRRGWWVLRLVLADLLRHPVRTVIGVGLLGVGAYLWVLSAPWQQQARLAALAVLCGLLLAVWRWRARRSFDWAVGRWWGSWWRRRYVYGPSWKTLALRHSLYVTDRRDNPGGGGNALVLAWADTPRALREEGQSVEVARLKRVRFTGRTDHLLVALPSGMTPDTVIAACDSLAHAWRVLAVRVRPAGPGRVWLDITRADTLARPLVLGGVPQLTDPASVLAGLAGLSVGVLEDGTSWRLRLRGAHVLIAGTTGSGKSSLLWAIVAGLSTAIHAGLVRVTWLDPKGGMEAIPARPLAHVVDRIDDMADTLDALVLELDQRAASLAGVSRQHEPSVSSPHRVVVVDELATLTALADSKSTRRVEAALGALLSRGRAVGFTVITTTVDPSKEVVRWRGLHAVRVAFRLDEPIQVDMVLGDGALHRGAACDRIPLATPGVCFVRLDGVPDPQRARAVYVPDQTIEQLGRAYPVPALAGGDKGLPVFAGPSTDGGIGGGEGHSGKPGEDGQPGRVGGLDPDMDATPGRAPSTSRPGVDTGSAVHS